ncbi:MAG: EAL domain-containing protein [Nitrospirota bacterium]
MNTKNYFSIDANQIFRILIILIPFIYTFLGYLVNEREKYLIRLKESEEKHRTLSQSLVLFRKTFETMQLGVTITDLQGKILYTNQADAAMHGYTVEELIGKDVRLFAPPEMSNPMTAERIESFGRWRRESINKRKDGSTFPVMLMSDVVKDINSQTIGIITTCEDITTRKQFEDQIIYLAYHDTLTSLPNRYLLKDRLRQAIAMAKQHNQIVAILFLDLDHFKGINDTFGHDMGDMLLKAIADRIAKFVRAGDTVARLSTESLENTVARLGGDEFIILLTEINIEQDAAAVAQRVLDMLSEPFTIGNNEIFINASIGISLYPHDGEDIDTLLKKADIAMYHTKDMGRNSFHFYSESMNIAISERYAIESKLRKALERNEFQLFYQPYVDVSNGRIIGLESLIRWIQIDSMEEVLPNMFIPIAEETGLIVPIGEWVIRTACTQNKAWHTAGFEPMPVTVNISGIQFRRKDFVETVAQILSEVSLDPQYLELELTESTIMQKTEETVDKFKKLKAMGVRISIDDFGTGYSSLSYLKRFPLSTLKIDRTFIQDVDKDNATIAKAIIALGHSLNLKVIAEGVETKQQAAFLSEHDCDGMQGCLISAPLDANKITGLLKGK